MFIVKYGYSGCIPTHPNLWGFQSVPKASRNGCGSRAGRRRGGCSARMGRVNGGIRWELAGWNRQNQDETKKLWAGWWFGTFFIFPYIGIE